MPGTEQAGTRPDPEEADPPLSDEEIRDVEYFYAHPEENKTMTLQELLGELREECKDAGSEQV